MNLALAAISSYSIWKYECKLNWFIRWEKDVSQSPDIFLSWSKSHVRTIQSAKDLLIIVKPTYLQNEKEVQQNLKSSERLPRKSRKILQVYCQNPEPSHLKTQRDKKWLDVEQCYNQEIHLWLINSTVSVTSSGSGVPGSIQKF